MPPEETLSPYSYYSDLIDRVIEDPNSYQNSISNIERAGNRLYNQDEVGDNQPVNYLDEAKILVGDSKKGGFGGMSLKDIMLYGGLGTGILGKLIEGGQQDGGDAQIAKNRTVYDQIFDPTKDVISYAAKGGVMDLQDGGESKGPGTGTSDSIPAMLSDGEFVMTAKAVRGAGGGDRREGARKMYETMDQLEAKA